MSWPVATVGEVCEVVSGATPRTGTPEFWGGNVPWVTPKDLSELGQKHLSDTPRKITKAGLKSCSARMLPAQSVLFSSRAPIGLVAINTLPVCTNQGFKSLVPRFDLVSPDFIFWWLKGPGKAHPEQRARSDVQGGIQEDRRRPPNPPPAPRRAEADCGDIGCGGRLAGKAPRVPRPARHPSPVHLPRHVRRPRYQSDGVGGDAFRRHRYRYEAWDGAIIQGVRMGLRDSLRPDERSDRRRILPARQGAVDARWTRKRLRLLLCDLGTFSLTRETRRNLSGRCASFQALKAGSSTTTLCVFGFVLMLSRGLSRCSFDLDGWSANWRSANPARPAYLQSTGSRCALFPC